MALASTLSRSEALVLKAIDDMKDNIVELTKELVKIPTINPPGEHYPEFAELVAKKLEELGLEVSTVYVPQDEIKKRNLELPRPLVIGVLKGLSLIHI